MEGSIDKFPRNLSIQEITLLNSILPENKPGYKKYRERISRLVVTGLGKFGSSNLILGKADREPDLSAPPTPIFASGTVISREAEIDITIHSEANDEIEVDISPKNTREEEPIIEENLQIIDSWSYSDWVPGEKAPHDNSEIREIIIIPERYLLAIAPGHKKIWLHEYFTGVNHLIPVTNFHNQLMMLKNIRDISLISNHALFFKNLSSYSDKEIISAFILYNNYFKRFSIDFSAAAVQKNNSTDEERNVRLENSGLLKKFYQKFYKKR
jgi:hypothetical protein